MSTRLKEPSRRLVIDSLIHEPCERVNCLCYLMRGPVSVTLLASPPLIDSGVGGFVAGWWRCLRGPPSPVLLVTQVQWSHINQPQFNLSVFTPDIGRQLRDWLFERLCGSWGGWDTLSFKKKTKKNPPHWKKNLTFKSPLTFIFAI